MVTAGVMLSEPRGWREEEGEREEGEGEEGETPPGRERERERALVWEEVVEGEKRWGEEGSAGYHRRTVPSSTKYLLFPFFFIHPLLEVILLLLAAVSRPEREGESEEEGEREREREEEGSVSRSLSLSLSLRLFLGDGGFTGSAGNPATRIHEARADLQEAAAEGEAAVAERTVSPRPLRRSTLSPPFSLTTLTVVKENSCSFFPNGSLKILSVLEVRTP